MQHGDSEPIIQSSHDLPSIDHISIFQHQNKHLHLLEEIMGVQPHYIESYVHEKATKPRVVSSLGKHHGLRWHRNHTPTVALPKEAQQLKEKIIRTHNAKLKRFSMSHMKKRVVPPVEIPNELNSQRALSITVSGRNVPLTRSMWDNTKRKMHHMEQISEDYPLRCTLYR
ncbi:hypothetical protein Plhal304r1_c021g0073971 [Plasmopara halstedii]